MLGWRFVPSRDEVMKRGLACIFWSITSSTLLLFLLIGAFLASHILAPLLLDHVEHPAVLSIVGCVQDNKNTDKIDDVFAYISHIFV
jgi:hypothetical protein